MAKACLFLVGLFALAALAWMVFLPVVVERELRAVTGFEVRVTSLAANPFTGSVSAGGLMLANPPAYSVPDFVELRAFKAEINEFSWVFGDRLIIDELSIDASKIELVLERSGRSNAAEFAAAFSRGPAPASPSAPAPSKPFRYLVKSLHLKVDRLVVADYSGLNEVEKTYDLHLDQTFSNVSDPKQLLVPDVIRSLYSFGLNRNASQLLPGEFGKALGDAVGGAAQMGTKVKDAEQRAKNYVKGLLDKLEH
jgi:hypothetical protein